MNVATPELDKRRAAIQPQPVNDTLTAFYDWLRADGLVLARWHDKQEFYGDCDACTLDGQLHPTGKDTSKLRRRHRQAIRDWPMRRNQIAPIPGRKEYEAFLYQVLDPLPPCPKCHGQQAVAVMKPCRDYLAEHNESPERLFARFLGIDLAKIDQEQRALLDALRAA